MQPTSTKQWKGLVLLLLSSMIQLECQEIKCSRNIKKLESPLYNGLHNDSFDNPGDGGVG